MTTLTLRSTPDRGGPAVAGPLLAGPALAWAALCWNVLTYLALPTLVPIPSAVGQAVAQAMLPLALLLALLANPRGVIRPNLFLGLLSLFAALAILSSVHNVFVVGSTFRAVRLATFVAVLWLLTPWWGRPDLPLLRTHLLFLRVVLASVVLGVVLAPGLAFSFGGRLSGILWPIPPTQVAHYGAVLLGCTVVLWFCRVVPGRTALFTVVTAGPVVALTHTRTALVALLIAFVVAGGSLFLGHARVRRTMATIVVVGGVIGALFTPALVAWAGRGQSAQDVAQLTGRTKVWSAIFALDRPFVANLFGSGLSNKSYQGLPIDSNWVATYLDSGWVGAGIDVAVLLVLLLVALTRPRGPRRAVALFLVVYCVVASFTETGLGDASPYLLELAVAASLLAGPTIGRRA